MAEGVKKSADLQEALLALIRHKRYTPGPDERGTAVPDHGRVCRPAISYEPTPGGSPDPARSRWFHGGIAIHFARLLAVSDAGTRIVPGYGAVMSRADLQAERDMMRTVYERAVDRVRQGDDAADMVKAGVLNDLPRTWKDPERFLYDVQKGLWAHHNKLAANVV